MNFCFSVIILAHSVKIGLIVNSSFFCVRMVWGSDLRIPVKIDMYDNGVETLRTPLFYSF